MTVLGQDLAARDGKAATVPKGRNTALTEDGTALVATRTGHVEFNGRTFQVKSVMDIDGNVDYSTGHINFLGDVHVHGDVCTGFIVRAMGNITVDGVVEVRSGRGTIIGGSIRAAHEASAGVLGSRAETHTDVVLGGLPCQEFDREVLAQEIAGLEEELEKLERQPESPAKFTRMGKLRMQLSLNKGKLEQFERDLEELRENQGEPGVRRLTCSVAYPGASVAIGPAFYRFNQETRPVVASLTEGEICII